MKYNVDTSIPKVRKIAINDLLFQKNVFYSCNKKNVMMVFMQEKNRAIQINLCMDSSTNYNLWRNFFNSVLDCLSINRVTFNGDDNVSFDNYKMFF